MKYDMQVYGYHLSHDSYVLYIPKYNYGAIAFTESDRGST